MPRVLSADVSLGKRSMRWSLPWSRPQAVPVVFQLAGWVNVKAPKPPGGVIDQDKSEVLA